VTRGTRQTRCVALVGLVCALAAACSQDRPVQVTAIQVGRARNADKTIGQQTFEFRPSDTIYAAVVLEGRASDVKVTARWVLPGGLTNEAEQTVSPRDRAVAAFELRNSGGFPAGRYRLEVLMNGTPVGTKELQVR
jgi:hypothetical protein